jgi:hypothetical protein
MTATLPVQSFRFESEYDTSDITRPLNRKRPTKVGLTEDQLLMGFGVLGALLLFWKFTISLGAGILAMGTFLWAMRERSRAIHERYQALREPATHVHVGATESRYWIRGDDFAAEAAWERVINAIEHDGMLIVQGWNMPRVYFPVDELRRAGVYDAVHAIVDKRSVAYRARLAEARAPRP